MKKNLILLVEVSMILLAFVCATSNIAAAAPLGSMTWDEINRTAATQEVVFTCWYSEELFTKICRDFTEKTGIKATLVVSDSSAVANKLIAEKGMDKASIDVIVVGGQHVKLTIDAGI